MVEDIDLKDLPCGDDLFCHLHIFRAGGGVAAGMIVDDDEGCAVGPHRLCKDLIHTNGGRVQAAGLDLCDPLDMVFCIQKDDPHLFPF